METKFRINFQEGTLMLFSMIIIESLSNQLGDFLHTVWWYLWGRKEARNQASKEIWDKCSSPSCKTRRVSRNIKAFEKGSNCSPRIRRKLVWRLWQRDWRYWLLFVTIWSSCCAILYNRRSSKSKSMVQWNANLNSWQYTQVFKIPSLGRPVTPGQNLYKTSFEVWWFFPPI